MLLWILCSETCFIFDIYNLNHILSMLDILSYLLSLCSVVLWLWYLLRSVKMGGSNPQKVNFENGLHVFKPALYFFYFNTNLSMFNILHIVYVYVL